MATIPTLSNYGQYSSDNYGAHTLTMRIGDLDLWFSYRTVVAFYTPLTGKVVCRNQWGPTTGKHLNWIDCGNRDARIPRDDFVAQLAKVIERYELDDSDVRAIDAIG